jgi:hypothetical protein
VPWIAKERTRELPSALSRTRVLEGREKDAVYQEFELLALRSKIHTRLKGHGLGFALTSSPLSTHALLNFRSGRS